MDWLKQWWFIVAAVASIAMGAGVLNNKVDNLERRLSEKIIREQKLEDMVEKIVRFEEQIKSLSADIADIKKFVENSNDDVKKRVEGLTEWIKKVNDKVKDLERARR